MYNFFLFFRFFLLDALTGQLDSTTIEVFVGLQYSHLRDGQVQTLTPVKVGPASIFKDFLENDKFAVIEEYNAIVLNKEYKINNVQGSVNYGFVCQHY